MERYAVSWPDVYAHANDDFDGLNTARFATLREAVPCAMKHSGIIRNMKESPADGGKARFYNEPGEWSATGVPWGYARDCFIAAAGDALLALCTADEEPLSALGYNRYNLNYEDRMRFEHECIRFYCDMLPHLRFPVSYELANRAGSLFIAARCGTGIDFMAEDKRFGGYDKARLFTEMAWTYEALVVFPSGWMFSILWNGRVQQ